MGIIPAIASTPSMGEISDTPKIQMAALFCILSKIFLWYEIGALL